MSDPRPLPLRCACGVWRASFLASPEAGQHGTCYCDDCQAYARFLGRDDTLDAHGGTEVVQTWPARVIVEAGAEQLRRMQLSEKGLHRWFAGCCRAPIGNTFGPRWPFVGLIAKRVEASHRPELEALFGPAIGVQGRFAPGGCPPGVLPSANLRVIGGAAVTLARGWRKGAHQPSPFYDPSGHPRAEAEVLSPEARRALR